MPGVPRRMSMDPDANRSNPRSRPSSLEMSVAEESDEEGDKGEDNPVFNQHEHYA